MLNVPFLAVGELELLIRNRTVHVALYLVLVFLTAYTVSVLRGATFDAVALAERLPSGKHVFGAGSPAHRLPQLISIPSYLILVGGACWSALADARPPRAARPLLRHAPDRGRRHLDRGVRFRRSPPWGTSPGFSIALLAGISVMFLGFLAGPARCPCPCRWSRPRMGGLAAGLCRGAPDDARRAPTACEPAGSTVTSRSVNAHGSNGTTRKTTPSS